MTEVKARGSMLFDLRPECDFEQKIILLLSNKTLRRLHLDIGLKWADRAERFT